MNKNILGLFFIFTVLLALPLWGQPEGGEENWSVTHHSIEINGRTVPYTATAGTLPLKTENEPKGYIYFTAYTRDDVKDLSKRPVTFAFNGGPGSSSIWLHMGALGPKKVLLSEDGLEPAYPFQLIDNPYSIIDITDLVMIDPVSTGFSRAVTGENPNQFHGYQEDIESVGEFIRLYITRFNRWSSPKYILGESYGTIRASGLAGLLQGRGLGMYLDGVILVSAVLNSLTKDFSPGNDLPYIFFLPGYTAAAWYHKKLPGDLLDKPLAEVLEESESFALGALTDALLQGNRISQNEKNSIIQKLSRYTGLSPDYIEQSNLRINLYRFIKELLRNEHKVIGRIDSRFTNIESDAAGERFEFDPSSTAITGAFAALFNEYVRTELQYDSEDIYAVSGQVRPWGYGESSARTQFSNSIEVLRRALTQNPHLRIFVANGYYDFATPYFATKYAVSHLGLNAEFTDRIEMQYYESGHMMYIRKKSHQKLKNDLENFYQRHSPSP
jgi:carboxypeptidase C (cathepsin A)